MRVRGGDEDDRQRPAPGASRPPASLSSGELVREIGREAERLVKAQIALARAELRADLMREAQMGAGLGVSALAALVTLNMLLVTTALALALVLPAWAAGLIVSGLSALVAVVAAAVGWRRRITNPLARTRRELKEDATWARRVT
ncbi:MAG TPA: phage holin family protein [Polyangia bacterium]|nr:phage holin family protein [Polyangia bacterium]